MALTLNRKIDFAIKLLQSIPQDGPIELSYSGGKDSDVILELAKISGIPFEAIYKNTTIDPPGTIAHCKENGVKIVQPKETFLEIVAKRGMPNRFKRFCCAILKEYKIHDRAIQGIRRAESTKRAERYKEPEFCRTYPKGEKARIYLPILEWTLEDVKTFITDRNIKLAPVYYTSSGEIDFTKRLGCIGCPMATDHKRREQYKEYPRLLKALIGAQEEFYRTHPDSPSARLFEGDAYRKFAGDLFFDRNPKEVLGGGLFEMPDAKEFLSSYFNCPL